MIATFLGAQGAGAAVLRERSRALGTDIVVAEPELVLLAAPGAVSSHVDAETACVVWGSPDVAHLPGARAAEPPSAIAAAFRTHREEAVSLLRPPFALLLWSRRAQTGLVATDQLGARSVFTARMQRDMVFSGEIADLLAILPTRPTPNMAALSSWLTGGDVPPDSTLYEGIDRLPGGYLLALGQGTTGARRYAARPPVDVLQASPDELADRVRDGIQRAVEARLPTGATAGILLSGGIDSTSVAAATARAQGNERTIAVSAVFPDRPGADESALISAVAKKLALREERVSVDVSRVFGDALDFQARWQLPAVSPTLGFQLTLQRVAASAGATVLLDGEGGDELFGLRPYLIADAVRRGRAVTAWRLARGLGGDARTARQALVMFGLKGAAPLRAHELRGARRPGWLREDVAFELPADTMGYAWKSLPGPRWYAEGRDQLTRHRERIGAHDYLRRRAAMTGSVAAHPFLQDLDLVELALRLPPEQAFFSEHDRPMLRAAMVGELPDVVRLRSGKSYFNHLFEEALNGPDSVALEALLAPGAEISAVVRPSFLEEVLAAPVARRRGVWSWTAWRFATAECWLRFQSDPDFWLRTPGLENLAVASRPSE